MVHHVHGHTAVEVGRGWRAWLSAKVEKYSLARASAVIAVSPTAAKYISAWGVPRERIHLVPNGVPARKKLQSAVRLPRSGPSAPSHCSGPAKDWKC